MTKEVSLMAIIKLQVVYLNFMKNKCFLTNKNWIHLVRVKPIFKRKGKND